MFGCTDNAPPTVPGGPGSGIGEGGGTGGAPGVDGGVDAGVDGGEPSGACENESDTDAIESAGGVRDIARNCGLILCANFVGNSSGYESCVGACVANTVQGLSSECAACYGGIERCSLDAFCRQRCQNDTCSMTCLECLNGGDCVTEFEECRGFRGDGCPDPA